MASPWIYRPWLDLVAGCGAWSAPLLLLVYVLAAPEARAWSVAFYGLALVFNYPHFMATIYRAYGTRADFSKYRVVTMHLTGFLVLTALVAHASFPLVPWIFTVYLTWSPWHYTGQNYGLLMMFVRRNGATPTSAERRALHLAFVASYAILFLTFHSGPSSDPAVISLGLPQSAARLGQALLGVAFVGLGGFALVGLVRQTSLRAMVAPLTLFTTQILWFVLPTMIEQGYGLEIPQSRYSTGILAVMHAVQYLWITSYYAKREASARGDAQWRIGVYFLTLVAGGIALFIFGPWVVSYVFRYDLAASFMIFTALVNIHHFVLDGAIWKLRDGRIAALLLDTRARVATTADGMSTYVGDASRWIAGRSVTARTVRVALAALLLLLAGVDQVRYAFSLDDGNLPRLLAAARLNPYDSTIQIRIANVRTRSGEADQAVESLTRAVAVNPANPAPQQALGRVLIESGRYQAAYDHYHLMLTHFPRDPDVSVNLGILASQLGREDEAVAHWRQAVSLNPDEADAHLHLAELLDGRGEIAAALPHYETYLSLTTTYPERNRPEPDKVIPALLRFADVHARLERLETALELYGTAITMAQQTGEHVLEAFAHGRMAELHDTLGDFGQAARAYQRALAIDAATEDAQGEGLDWFNYGRFLERGGLPARLAFACFLKSEELLGSTPGAELDTVTTARQRAETSLGDEAADVRRDLPSVLSEALAWAEADFADER